MAALLSAHVPLGMGLPTLSDTRLCLTRHSSRICCSNGAQREDSESAGDWNAAWEKLKEKRGKLDGVSGPELMKTERPTTELVGKDSDFQDGRDVGPRLTKWGGSVRGGRYRLGEGADRMLEFFGNGDVALIAAIMFIILIFVLLQFKPPSASF